MFTHTDTPKLVEFFGGPFDGQRQRVSATSSVIHMASVCEFQGKPPSQAFFVHRYHYTSKSAQPDGSIRYYHWSFVRKKK